MSVAMLLPVYRGPYGTPRRLNNINKNVLAYLEQYNNLLIKQFLFFCYFLAANKTIKHSA